MPHKNKFTFHRSEKRIPMEIPLMLEGNRKLPGVETTFTENVSARGARVISVRHWDKNAELTVASRSGEFRSSARVAYCQPIHGDGYAIGLEFLETQGRWVVESAN